MSDRDKSLIDDAALDSLFQDARATAPQVPQALMDRVVADGRAQQPAFVLSGWRSWFRSIGGATGFGGLVTATCVGFWIGVAPPEGVPDISDIVWGVETTADTTGFGWDVEEG